MNIALVLSGGKGTRTTKKIPKQYLTVNDIPIIIYTLQNLQKCSDIDEIYVVCAENWSDFITAYVEDFKIPKFKGVIIGGESRYESFCKGYRFLCDNKGDEDVVLLIDANRPLIPHNVFHESVLAASDDCAVLSVDYCHDSMYAYGNNTVSALIDRDLIVCGQTPETAKVKEIKKVLFNDSVYSDTSTITEIFLKNEIKIKCVIGSSLSKKITTKDDLEFFKALLTVNSIDQ